MSEVLVHVTRGPMVESIHRGDAVVVDHRGHILKTIGDPFKQTYMRSAAKPLQTLAVIASGASERYHFTDAELALMCASHYGEPFHREAVLSMLDKMGLCLEDLKCGVTLSISPSYAKELIASHFELGPYNNDCSGKHCGMLATCLMKAYPIEGYTGLEHPVQQDILRVVAEMCCIPEDQIIIGIDGCSVPVHGMPLYNMALGFARLANPDGVVPHLKNACQHVFSAMNAAPEMVAGTDGFCTALIQKTGGKLIGKLGAEGVYCIGIKGHNLGLALKIEDGNYARAISPAVLRCLDDLGVLTSEEYQSLSNFAQLNNMNGSGMIVGKVEAVFHLEDYQQK